MKHIFILNPAAGNMDAESKILPRIISEAKKAGIDYEIHRTMGVGDGENYVRNRCLAAGDVPVRFYAVGGDGTLNEVANGAFGFSNVEIGFIPWGTGNDFARCFKDSENFRDIRRQIHGKSQQIDLIKYNNKVAINVVNIGIDCSVVVEMNRLKSLFRLRGTMAYMAGVLAVFSKNKGYALKVTLDDGMVFDREFTLIAIGNGSYYGGGFKGIPRAEINDGFLDVSIIDKVSRRTFAALIGKYRKGTHLESPSIDKIITYRKCRTLTVESFNTIEFCVDGEVLNNKKLDISIIPNGIRFSVPEGSDI